MNESVGFVIFFSLEYYLINLMANKEYFTQFYNNMATNKTWNVSQVAIYERNPKDGVDKSARKNLREKKPVGKKKKERE